jgi:hypothetical protein
VLRKVLPHRTSAEDGVAKGHSKTADPVPTILALNKVRAGHAANPDELLGARIAALSLPRALDLADHPPNLGLVFARNPHDLSPCQSGSPVIYVKYSTETAASEESAKKTNNSLADQSWNS